NRNTNLQRRKGEAPRDKPFRKHGVVALATYKGDIADFKGMGTVPKGMPHKCNGKTGRVYNTNKGKLLAKRINVHLEHSKHSKSQDNFLKHMKENDQKKKETKEKGAYVQLKRQPAPPREVHSVRTNRKEPELLLPVNSWHNK
uniref:60S ribosomal protein L21 n=1 Tax=Otolemur garnettii TaxID=30611 RepID=H0XPN0_OTOGA